MVVGGRGRGRGVGYDLLRLFPLFRASVNQWLVETGVRGESVAELGVSHVTRARLVPIAVKIL